MPVLISGGLRTAAAGARGVRAHGRGGGRCSPAARSATRGCSTQLLGGRDARADPRRDPRRARLGASTARVEHLGDERASRYLRKFYPWYVERLGGTRGEQAALQAALQQAESIEQARELFAGAQVGERLAAA